MPRGGKPSSAAIWLLTAGLAAVCIGDASLAAAGQRATGGTSRGPVPATATPTTLADGRTIFGPPPPLAPEVMTRDATGRATLRATRLSEPLRVDGRLDEAVYQTVKPMTGFIQSLPDIGQPSTEQTETWVFFDNANLYVVCRCLDSAPPSEWVANEMRRDSAQIRENDGFGVMIDTFYDRRNAVNFVTNALGGLLDSQYTNEGNSNADWNAVWTVKTARFDGGWAAEMQIPFKSLRYSPGADQVWGLQLRRVIRRKNEFTFLTPMPPDGASAWQRISMLPTLVGLQVPQGGRNIDIKPYVIARVSTDKSAVPAVLNHPTGDLGADAKYGVTQNLSLDLTYNTDFAQVEADEQQVNLTRFNLVFPEKREFFLEGKGIYQFGHGTTGVATSLSGTSSTLPEVFYTRQIGLNAGRILPILAGARLTGRVGPFTLGAMNIASGADAPSNTPRTDFTVLRLNRNVLRRSSVGLIFTERSASLLAPGASNEAFGADGSFSFYRNLNVNGFYARTRTPGLIGQAKDSYLAHFDYSPDRYGAVVEHTFVGDAFNPEVGFLQRKDMRRTFAAARFSPRPTSSRWVRRFAWEGAFEHIANTAGRLESRQEAAKFTSEWLNSDQVSIEYDRSFEGLVKPFRVSRTVNVPAGNYEFDTVQASYAFGRQRKWFGSVTTGHGAFYDGTQHSIGLSSARVQITPQVSIEPSFTTTWIALPGGEFNTQVYRMRGTYTVTPRLFASGLVQYNSSASAVSTNVRLRWEYQPGSEFFVVYTEDRDTTTRLAGQFSAALINRGIVIKFNRLVRF